MPKAKTPKNPPLSKSDFIRSQPATMSAKEVVAKAKAAGIKFAPVLVYKVRGRAKSKKSAAKKTSTMVMSAPMTSATKPAKSKSGFIRSLPSGAPAKEVVKQAKVAGIKLNVGYVYNVRQAAKKAKRQAWNGVSVPRPIDAMSSAENLLRAVAAEIGLGAAIEILSGERARIAVVIGG
jgi:hypothetical protein